MPRTTRAQSTAITRQRIVTEARRLFREQGYAATSLEHIADAAGLTKGAIYGHFSSKEDLLLNAVESEALPDMAALNDTSRPVRERLTDHGRALGAKASAGTSDSTDRRDLAVSLEFLAALLRNPEAARRTASMLAARLGALADADLDEPEAGTTRLDVWSIGYALSLGLEIAGAMAPDLYPPERCARAFELFAALYPCEPDRPPPSN